MASEARRCADHAQCRTGRYTHEIRTRARAVPRQACGNDEAEKSRAQGELESIPPHQHPHSVILIGCADDLVVPDPGCEYAGSSVRGNRPLHALAASFAASPCGPRRNRQRSGTRASLGSDRTLMLFPAHAEISPMSKLAIQTLVTPQERALDAARQVALVVGGSLFVALSARVTIPLFFTPVPLTLQNFAVILVGLLLGSRRGFAALALYLAERAMGMPVFNPTGPGGIAQVLGATGGYLMVYPLVAFLVGLIFERGTKTFTHAAIAGTLGEILLFAGGLTWLYVMFHSLKTAAYLGLYWFVAAEVIKVR